MEFEKKVANVARAGGHGWGAAAVNKAVWSPPGVCTVQTYRGRLGRGQRCDFFVEVPIEPRIEPGSIRGAGVWAFCNALNERGWVLGEDSRNIRDDQGQTI